MKIMARLKKFIDIGANLTDEMYQGVYHQSKKHEPDLDTVLARSWDNGLVKLILTGGSVSDAKAALDLAQSDPRLFTTVGCHPTRCKEFLEDPDGYLDQLRQLIKVGKDKVVAIGECGLDYDRLYFCPKDIQQKYFELQLSLCEQFDLPLFLHCRAAGDDFLEILSRNKTKLHGGVVHSFDGNEDTMRKIVDLGFYIGINGCSLRTAESLGVAEKIPSDRLMVETDSPWCEIKQTHPGFKHIMTKFPSSKKEKYSPGCQVKGRNEPANIVQVVEILAAIRSQNVDELAEIILNNTNKVFFKS